MSFPWQFINWSIKLVVIDFLVIISLLPHMKWITTYVCGNLPLWLILKILRNWFAAWKLSVYYLIPETPLFKVSLSLIRKWLTISIPETHLNSINYSSSSLAVHHLILSISQMYRLTAWVPKSIESKKTLQNLKSAHYST